MVENDTVLKANDKEITKRAAYALNMCTVSVAQIVDYNDEYILEQEYDAILNNINLEQIPKDEALLNILTELLNTITFFRIQEIKKNQIENKYKRRLSNAIWSAVPNIGLIVAGGNPVTMAISIASQIGIGYMNYRKERADAVFEKDKEKIELQITAIEQFDAIKRELFTTAWRLADVYHFPDEYRLTEKQIKQYNRILMDSDELRKYERLEAIQENFHAYPTFWYFFGHTANYIAGSSEFNLDIQTRKKYQNLAKSHFQTYVELNKFSILREDQIAASCMLEYVDLMLLEKKPNYSQITELLKEAIKKSGKANDVLQICALTYIRIGHLQEAAALLKILVNEDYNRSTNARLLSRIYVTCFLKSNDSEIRTEYDVLKNRVNETYIFPMPKSGIESDEHLQVVYMAEQRAQLQYEYRYVISKYINQYSLKANRIISIPIENEIIDDAYYSDKPTAKRKRYDDAKRALCSNDKEHYIADFARENFRKRYIDLLNDMLQGFDSLSIFNSDAEERMNLIRILKENIFGRKEKLALYQKELDSKRFSIDSYYGLQENLNFRSFTKGFVYRFKDYVVKTIDLIETNEQIEKLWFELESFCIEHNINLSNDLIVSDKDTKGVFQNSGYLRYTMLGMDVINNSEEHAFDEMVLLAKNMVDQIIISSGASIYVSGDSEFNMYFKNSALSQTDIKDDTIVILDDKTKKDFDLLLTRKGFIIVKNNKVQVMRNYAKISYIKYKNKGSLQLGWPDTFANDSVCIEKLYELIEKFEEILFNAK